MSDSAESAETVDQQSENAIRDSIARCFNCRQPIDPRAETGSVELNPHGGGNVGYRHGNLCDDCEQEFAKKMERTTGGNV